MATKEYPTIGELQKLIHQNAINHGFAIEGERRSLDEHCILIHSEISEALEAYREYDVETNSRISEKGKPEGLPSELADVIIRLLDCAEEYGQYLYLESDLFYMQKSIDESYFIKSVVSLLADLHRLASNIGSNATALDLQIVSVLLKVIRLCKDYDIDIANEVEQKMAYNLSRPYKHGNKVI